MTRRQKRNGREADLSTRESTTSRLGGLRASGWVLEWLRLIWSLAVDCDRVRLGLEVLQCSPSLYLYLECRSIGVSRKTLFWFLLTLDFTVPISSLLYTRLILLLILYCLILWFWFHWRQVHETFESSRSRSPAIQGGANSPHARDGLGMSIPNKLGILGLNSANSEFLTGSKRWIILPTFFLLPTPIWPFLFFSFLFFFALTVAALLEFIWLCCN